MNLVQGLSYNRKKNHKIVFVKWLNIGSHKYIFYKLFDQWGIIMTFQAYVRKQLLKEIRIFKNTGKSLLRSLRNLILHQKR